MDNVTCSVCNNEVSISEAASMYGTYFCQDCWEEESRNDESDMPFGCRACGGPYPDCTTSCKMFD